MTQFGNLKSDSGLKALNDYLGDRSYIEGYAPTQADASVFEGIGKAPSANFPHALRWYNQISSFGAEKSKFPGEKKALSNSAPAADEDEDEEVDLFGSDDEEEDAEAARIREERLAAYAAKKSAKPGPIAKSQIMLDVKPWDDETDMKVMEDQVRTVTMDGLVWGAKDAKVSVDDLTEKIEAFEDYVQSVDVAAFNKV